MNNVNCPSQQLDSNRYKNIFPVLDKSKNSEDNEQVVVKTATGRFLCSLCEKSFKKINSFNQHFDRVHDNKHYECSICEDTLSSSYRLKSHCEKLHGFTLSDIQVKSALVKITESGVETAPEAKDSLIILQEEQIKELKKKIFNANIVKKYLLNRIT